MADYVNLHAAIAEVYQASHRKVFATLVRLLGDMDLAEEAVHEAFVAAVERWPGEGVPENPAAWLISAGRFKAIDLLRRRERFDALKPELGQRRQSPSQDAAQVEIGQIEDDQLRLIFTCCHPALPPEARLALTLREVCGLSTEDIASAFLASPSTIAQRIVRAKNKIRSANIPYQVPTADELPERLDGALHVIYLVYTEGYAASSGDALTRPDLSGEAIRLGRLLAELLPEPEVFGLLALMLLQESRRVARTGPGGELISLEAQDRSRWDREMIREGLALAERALAADRISAYAVQASIAAVHAQATSSEATDWARIVALYELLLRLEQSPIVELNRAVAIGMSQGPAAGLVAVDAILSRGELTTYHLAHAARADFARRLGRNAEAREAYQRAIFLSRQEPERQFLQKRLEALGD